MYTYLRRDVDALGMRRSGEVWTWCSFLPKIPTLTTLRHPSTMGTETNPRMGLTATQLILALDEKLNSQEFPAVSVHTHTSLRRVEPLKVDLYFL